MPFPRCLRHIAMNTTKIAWTMISLVCIGLLGFILDSARPPGKSLMELKRNIAARADNDGASEHQLPDGFDAAMLLDRMIKRGFLQLSKTGRRYICPIPSLTDYVFELVDDWF